MQKTCELLGIKRSNTTAFHPMSNSIVERTNRTLINMFAKFLEQHEHSEWDKNLPLLLLGLRAQIHRSLGVSPYCVMFGREPRLPVQMELDAPLRGRTRGITEYLDELKANLKALHQAAFDKSKISHKKNKAVYDRKINSFNYSPGDKVYLHKGVVPKGAYYKFIRPWKPAVVVDKVGELNYRIKLDGSRSTLLVHHNRLKPRTTPDSDTTSRRSSEPQPTKSVRLDREDSPIGVVGEPQWNGHSDEPADSANSIPDQTRDPVMPCINLSPFTFVPTVPFGPMGPETDERLSPAVEIDRIQGTGENNNLPRRSASSNIGVPPDCLAYKSL